jgi:hypothetical protein
MAEIPDRANFYGTVEADLQPKDVARLFLPPIWNIRKCSWTDFEATSGFAEIVIESSNPVLIHGPVVDVSMNSLRIIEPLTAAGLFGTFECYDEFGVLILEKTFGGPDT